MTQHAETPSDIAERVFATLRERGHRITGPRGAVVDVLAGCGSHRSAEEIVVLAKTRSPSISRASVFRTLQLLLETGLLHSSSRAQHRTTYLLSPSGIHHHLVCTRCGSTIPFQTCVAGELEALLAKEHDFSISGHQLEVFGRCPDCR